MEAVDFICAYMFFIVKVVAREAEFYLARQHMQKKCSFRDRSNIFIAGTLLILNLSHDYSTSSMEIEKYM